MMEKKLTKTEYYEDITSLLIQSNLMEPSEVPNKNLYNKKIDYLNSLSRVIKKKYDIILNMESNDIKKLFKDTDYKTAADYYLGEICLAKAKNMC